ncbi:WD40-repeat-containing domain protein [Pisolithus marmoratus]|nr:WD40-repeat-containing domain protein [Pisolithus marmoratus]
MSWKGAFQAHQDGILCLAVSNDGSLLASGGFDGLRMWDLQNKVELRKPSQTRNARDPITCAAWLTLEDKRNNILCCGTGLGYVLFWKQNSTLATPEFEETVARRVGTGQEIMAINWCKGSDQLVTATYDKRVQLWTVGAKHTLTNIFSIELPTTVPRAIYFHGADILVFGMYDGEIHTLRGKDGIVLATKTIGRMIGNAAIDAAHTSFVIDNAVNGFSLHRIEDGVCTRTYDTNPRKGFPKQVAIAEGGSMVVGGSDDGLVYVFDKATSELVQTLRHSTNGRVQTVTVRSVIMDRTTTDTHHQTHDTGDIHYILAATSSNENDISISVWKKLATSSKRHQKKRGGLTALTALRSVWQALPHLTALAVIAMFALQMRVSSEVYTKTCS